MFSKESFPFGFALVVIVLVEVLSQLSIKKYVNNKKLSYFKCRRFRKN